MHVRYLTRRIYPECLDGGGLIEVGKWEWGDWGDIGVTRWE